MPNRVRQGQAWRAPKVPSESAAAKRGNPLALSLRAASGRRSASADSLALDGQVCVAQTLTASLQPAEVLIPDVRGHVSPAQMVERKLLYLLRNAGQGISVQRTADPFALQRHARGSGNPELPVGVPPPCNKTR
ncbi:MAG: hypothetical protein E6K70_13620 [Planctomycetota bacterium]|nr:MAG: hypothetical protein E6K70_13620 [Planctomycetota bacterium]